MSKIIEELPYFVMVLAAIFAYYLIFKAIKNHMKRTKFIYEREQEKYTNEVLDQIENEIEQHEAIQ